jgi:hypothetical protein
MSTQDITHTLYLLGGVHLGVGIAISFVHHLQVWRLLVLWQPCVFELLEASLLRALRPSFLGIALSCQIYLALSDSFIFNPQSIYLPSIFSFLHSCIQLPDLDGGTGCYRKRYGYLFAEMWR